MNILRSVWDFVYDFFVGDITLLVGVILTVALALILTKAVGGVGLTVAAPVLVACVLLVLAASLATEVRARR
jgi:hypothetical protein